MQIDLSDLNDAYRALQAGRFSDGIYPARLVKAEVSLSKAGRRQVVWELEVQDVVSARSILVKKYSQIGNDSLTFLHSELDTLGVALDDLNDLHQATRDLTGKKVEIYLKDSGDWYGATFLRLIERPLYKRDQPLACGDAV